MGLPVTEKYKLVVDSPSGEQSPMETKDQFNDGLLAMVESKKIQFRKAKGRYTKSEVRKVTERTPSPRLHAETIKNKMQQNF